MRRFALPLLVGSSAFFALPACGGQDEGRDDAELTPVAPIEPIEQCTKADAFELQSFAPFEPAGGPALCDATVDAEARCRFYFNYDNYSMEGAAGYPHCPPDAPADSTTTSPERQAESPPAGNQPQIENEDFGEPRCDATGGALHVQGTNVGVCYRSNGRRGWGGSMDIELRGGFDASAWDGLAFWVRKGAGEVGSAIILSASDPHTTAPACSTAEDALDSQKCDAFAVAVTLTEEWEYVMVEFATMTQKGFGVASPLGTLDTANLTRLQFLFPAGNWDFWVDDLTLFRSAE